MNHAHTGQSFSENGGPEFVPDGYSVDFECDRVEEFLARQAQRRPALLPLLQHLAAALPDERRAGEVPAMYRPEEIPIRPNVDLSKPLPDQDHWFKVYRWDFRYYNFHLPYTEELPEDYTLQRVIAEYYGMTTWVDDAVGRMLAALDANGLAEDTIVVFTSDHGDYLGSHGRVQKGDLHEESVRIPSDRAHPLPRSQLGGAAANPLRQGMLPVAGLVDIAPTLLDLVGVETPSHMHGRQPGKHPARRAVQPG